MLSVRVGLFVLDHKNAHTRQTKALATAPADEDHTCYTVDTAGAEGFLRLLPVYLDHVLFPPLKVPPVSVTAEKKGPKRAP